VRGKPGHPAAAGRPGRSPPAAEGADSSATRPVESDEVERLAHGLIPGWYAGVLSLLGCVLLVAAAVAAVALGRSSVGDFYRPPAARPSDDRWSAALRARMDGTGDDGPQAGTQSADPRSA
jgi:hypothetical protein